MLKCCEKMVGFLSNSECFSLNSCSVRAHWGASDDAAPSFCSHAIVDCKGGGGRGKGVLMEGDEGALGALEIHPKARRSCFVRLYCDGHCSSVGWTKEGDIVGDGDHLDVRTSSQFGGVDCWLESKAEEKAGEGLSLQAARLRGECANEKTCVVEE
jgi:hypothetical protein